MPQPVMLKSTFYCFPSSFSQFKTSCRREYHSHSPLLILQIPTLFGWTSLTYNLTPIWIWNQVSKIKTCFWKSIHFINTDIWLKIYCKNLLLILTRSRLIWCQLQISCSEPYLYHITCTGKKHINQTALPLWIK